VETQIARVNRRVVEFSYRIRTETTLLAEGRTVHVVIGADRKPRSLPDRYLELLQQRQ
jgi:acyl-CoA thioester hydrolase